MPRKPRPTYTYRYPNRSWADLPNSSFDDSHKEPYDPVRSPFTLPLANYVAALLPGLDMPAPAIAGAIAGSLHTRAPWPVWKDSTTKTVKFAPLPKKKAAQLWHKARRFDRQTRQSGKHGGAVGRTALDVLQVLLFDFLNYATGRLDPSLDAIAAKANMGRRTVVNALQRLRQFGLLHWLRRCREDKDEHGRFRLRQETNAYAVLPPSQWLGYHEPPPPPPPDLGTWGDHPPLPSQLEQAVTDRAAGDSAEAVLARLKDDPGDEQAVALAGLFSLVFNAKS